MINEVKLKLPELRTMFGQDVYYWQPLPQPPKMKGADEE